VLQHLSLHWVDQWPVAWQWVFAFIGWDFCFYWMHRMHHKLPIFWAVHVVHHQGEHFNLSLGIRNSWYSSLTSFLFVAILAVLGVPLEIFIAVSSFHYSVQFYNHNALVGKSGWLDKIMVTPSNHRVHHGMDPIYVNKNFGGTLLIWDKLFGTYQAERDDVPLRYGVSGSVSSNNPLWANNSPLQKFVQTHLPSLQNLTKLCTGRLYWQWWRYYFLHGHLLRQCGCWHIWVATIFPLRFDFFGHCGHRWYVGRAALGLAGLDGASGSAFCLCCSIWGLQPLGVGFIFSMVVARCSGFATAL
jgi:Fatty acid hydroxylase superfamily